MVTDKRNYSPVLRSVEAKKVFSRVAKRDEASYIQVGHKKGQNIVKTT
jgi:hypothetical protein